MADENFTVLVDKDTDSPNIFIGQANRGSATSAAVWQIMKVDKSSGNNVYIYFADKLDSFTKVWDDRTTYTYSS